MEEFRRGCRGYCGLDGGVRLWERGRSGSEGSGSWQVGILESGSEAMGGDCVGIWSLSQRRLHCLAQPWSWNCLLW